MRPARPSDIRDLIAAGVNAIVFNPNDPEALNPALAEAHAAGIKTVSVDAYVTDPNTYNLYNNQIKYAEIGARWLFEQLGGKGKVWYTRGIAGNPADSDRDIGFKNALKDYPDIEVVPNADGVFTKWDPATATQVTNDFISSGQYDQIQGIWASGMGKQIIDAIKAANKPFVPIADADVGGFVAQLLDPTDFPGLKGAAVTNTAAVGGAGVTLALKLLNGETVTTSPDAPQAEHGPARPGPGRQPDPRRAGRSSRPGSRCRAWIPCGRSACRSTAGRPTTRTPSPRPARARRPHLASTVRGAGHAGPPTTIHSKEHMAVTTTDLLLEATGVAKTYGAVVALRSASLAVRPGEVHALMGANGAGKSTLVKILSGAVRPDAGTIAIRGRNADRPLARRGPPRRDRVRLPGAGPHPRPRHPVEPAARPTPRSSRSATGWTSWA